MAEFQCRWPSNEEDWTPVPAYDPERAAEIYAAALCAHDNESYSAFESGEEIEVRLARTTVVVTYRVTCEFDPTFRASRVQGGG